MKTPLLLHLVRKDIRAFRVPLFLMWGAIVGMALLPVSPAYALMSRNLLIAASVLLLLVQVQALQLDPTMGTLHFLKTRPVSPRMLLLSKWVLLWLGGFLPVVLVGFIQIQRVGLSLFFTDYLWLCFQGLAIFLGCTGFLMPFAVYTRSILHLIGSSICGYLLLVVFALVFLEKPERWDSGISGIYYTNYTRGFVSLTLLGGAGYLIAAARFLHWKRRWQLLAAIMSLSLTGLCVRFWSVNWMPAPVATAIPEEPVKEALKPVVLEYQATPDNGGLSGWDSSGGLNAWFRIHNLPRQYFLQRAGWKSEAQLPDGRNIVSFSHSFRWENPDGTWYRYHWVTGRSAADLLGFPPASERDGVDPEQKLMLSPLFSKSSCWESGTEPKVVEGELPHAPLARVDMEDLRKSVITGECRFAVYRTSLLAEFPLTKGAAYTDRGVHIHIQDVESRTGSSSLTIKVAAYVWLKPVTAYLAHDSSKQLFSAGVNGFGASFYPAGFHVGTTEPLRERYRESDKDYPLVSTAADWSEGGRIYFFTAERAGSFAWPFEVKDMPLIPGRR